MAAFFLDTEDIQRINEAKRLALTNPIPLEVIKRIALEVNERGFLSGERPLDIPRPEMIDLKFGWRLNMSCEEQPGGLYLHISLSSPSPKKTVPRWEAITMIVDVLKCNEPVSAWVEEFKEDNIVAGLALNVLVPVAAAL